MAATSAAVAAVAANSREAALVAQQQQQINNYNMASGNNKRSTKPSQLSLNNINNNTGNNANINNNPPPAHINSNVYNSAMRYVKKEPTHLSQKEPTHLSPVKKRIKENKDHYAYADSNYSSTTQSPINQQQQNGHHFNNNNTSRTVSNAAIIINDDTPPLQGRNHQHHTVPEVITILDSDDETPLTEDQIKLENSAATSEISNNVTVKQDSTPVSSVSTTAVTTATMSLNTSGCPSVMPITPVIMLRQDGYSAQSTPSRSHAASCVTVCPLNKNLNENLSEQNGVSERSELTPL